MGKLQEEDWSLKDRPMEERVLKIIPKEDTHESSAIPRAIVRPPPGYTDGGKKRGAEEAIGTQIDAWAGS